MHLSDHALRARAASATTSTTPATTREAAVRIPVILKDNIATSDLPTTAGSVALGGSQPRKDAFIVRKLRRAGAIVLGKGR